MQDDAGGVDDFAELGAEVRLHSGRDAPGQRIGFGMAVKRMTQTQGPAARHQFRVVHGLDDEFPSVACFESLNRRPL